MGKKGTSGIQAHGLKEQKKTQIRKNNNVKISNKNGQNWRKERQMKKKTKSYKVREDDIFSATHTFTIRSREKEIKNTILL